MSAGYSDRASPAALPTPALAEQVVASAGVVVVVGGVVVVVVGGPAAQVATFSLSVPEVWALLAADAVDPDAGVTLGVY